MHTHLFTIGELAAYLVLLTVGAVLVFEPFPLIPVTIFACYAIWTWHREGTDNEVWFVMGLVAVTTTLLAIKFYPASTVTFATAEVEAIRQKVFDGDPTPIHHTTGWIKMAAWCWFVWTVMFVPTAWDELSGAAGHIKNRLDALYDDVGGFWKALFAWVTRKRAPSGSVGQQGEPIAAGFGSMVIASLIGEAFSIIHDMISTTWRRGN